MGGLFSDMSNTSRLWQVVKDNEDYEISEFYPFFVRNKKTHKIMKEQTLPNGYVYYALYIDNKTKSVLKHRLVALQFIPNHNNLPEINHINRVRNDNRLTNLEWATISQNNSKRTSYKGIRADYVERPTDLKRFLTYNQHTFNHRPIYYNNDGLYYVDGADCRKLYLHENERNCYVKDDEDKATYVSFKKIQKMFNRT
jgi:hypothetical protein